MPRMGKTEEDWNGLKLGFLKTVQPNSFQSWSLLLAASKIMPRRHLFVSGLWFCLILSNFFAYFKLHSDWRRVIGKIKQNDLDFRDTAPLVLYLVLTWCLNPYTKPLRTANSAQPLASNVVLFKHQLNSELITGSYAWLGEWMRKVLFL